MFLELNINVAISYCIAKAKGEAQPLLLLWCGQQVIDVKKLAEQSPVAPLASPFALVRTTGIAFV